MKKKCSVLRAGLLSQSETKYGQNTNFQWTSESVKALGITFCTRSLLNLKTNLEPKIDSFKNCLKQWQHRKLTLLGKVTVVKSLALPKLIYALSVLPLPSMKTTNDLEKCMFNFIWDGKPDKITRGP